MQKNDIEKKSVVFNVQDIRHDLYMYMEHVSNKSIKRSVRGNMLPKTELERLAKLFKNSSDLLLSLKNENSSWIYFIDELARLMKLTSYEVEGEYLGYTSREPSFLDNYIEVNEELYNHFLSAQIYEQENLIRDTLLNHESFDCNEFFKKRVLSRLDRYSSWGCATGLNCKVVFAQARKEIMDVLYLLQPDKWYSVQELIAMVKKQNRNFLLQGLDKKFKKNTYENFCEKIYENNEGYRNYKNQIVMYNDEDGFERVEGRYIERFLEGIPLELGYIELIFGESISQTNVVPSLGKLKCFKLKPIFFEAMKQRITPVKVTVNPNFEVFIDSPLFPIMVFHQLKSFCNVVSVDNNLIVLKLDRKKIVKFLASYPDKCPIKLLEKYTLLPDNVRFELSEQKIFSNTVVFYSGGALLKSDRKQDDVYESIDEHFAIISKTKKVYKLLQEKQEVPIIDSSFSNITSLYDKKRNRIQPKKNLKPKQSFKFKKEEYFNLIFENQDQLIKFELKATSMGYKVVRNPVERALFVPKEIENKLENIASNYV